MKSLPCKLHPWDLQVSINRYTLSAIISERFSSSWQPHINTACIKTKYSDLFTQYEDHVTQNVLVFKECMLAAFVWQLIEEICTW